MDTNQLVEPLLDCTRAAEVLGGVHPKTVERSALFDYCAMF